MSSRLQKSFDQLSVIAKLQKNKKLQRRLLREFANDPEFLAAIVEITQNTIKKRVPLNEHQLEKLRPHIKIIKKIASDPDKVFKKKSSRHRTIEQSGGFLQVLVPTIASLLVDLAARQFA